MKSGWLKYTALGLLFYAVFLVATVPATWLAWGITRVSHGTINLSQPSGRLWHGNGELVVLLPKATRFSFGHTEWRVNPLWLLTGRLDLGLNTSGSMIQLNGVLRFSRATIYLKDITAVFPAEIASRFYSPIRLLSPKGQIRFSTASLAIKQNAIQGNAELQWQGAGSKLSSVDPLGDYRLVVTGDGETARLELETVRGDLVLSGRGGWDIANEGRIEFVGNAKPRARRLELEPILRLLGRDQGGGQRALILDAHLPIKALLLF